MKIRRDFVTNSSSSSFLIEKKYLNSEQLNAIHMHSILGKALGLPWAEESWTICESEHFISGHTYMNNFYIADLFDIVGIENIIWNSYEDAFEAEDNLHRKKMNIEKEPLSKEKNCGKDWEEILNEIKN